MAFLLPMSEHTDYKSKQHTFNKYGGRLWWLPVVLLAILWGCGSTPKGQTNDTSGQSVVTHATLLHITKHDGFTRVDVSDPWDTLHTLATYLLVPQSDKLPPQLPKGTVVRTPLKKLVAFSAVHAALASELGCLQQVCGLCDKDYVCSSALKEALENGTIKDMGPAMQPSLELIKACGADALLISPFRDRLPGPAERLGIPVIVCADYMETSPLGRAEWMRFYGLLMGCEERADSLFNAVEQQYNLWKNKAKASQEKPSLMVDMRTGPVWYVAGGCSTMGTLYADAGLNYIYRDNKERGSVALDFEQVVSACHNADIWMLKYGQKGDITYQSLISDDPRYSKFKAWKERRVVGCNTLSTPFYEETPFHPERLLAEMVQMFHPELQTQDFKPHYLQPLKER